MTTTYEFKSEESFLWWILNAVPHDFLHDFNNYKRMNKILSEINNLVTKIRSTTAENILSEEAYYNNSLSPEQTVQAAVAVEEEVEKEVEEKVQLPDEDIDLYLDTLDETYLTVDTDSINRDANEPYYKYLMGKYNEFKQLTNNNGRLTRSNSITEAPKVSLFQTLDNFINKCKLLVIDVLKKSLDGDPIMFGGRELINPKSIQKHNKSKQNNSEGGQAGVTATAAPVTVSPPSPIRSKGVGESNPSSLGIKSLSEAKSPSIEKMETEPKNNIEKEVYAIDMITTNDIANAFDTIIRDVPELNEDGTNIKKVFEFMKQIFLSFDIPNISPLEKFNNSIITETTSMYIINNYNEMEQKISKEQNIYKGGNVRKIQFKDINDETKTQFDKAITEIKKTILYSFYIGTEEITEKITEKNYEDHYNIYANFIYKNSEILNKIIGEKRKISMETDITDKHNNNMAILNNHNSKRRSGRNIQIYIKNVIVSINNYIFDTIISTYEDIKNKSQSIPKSKVTDKKGVKSVNITSEQKDVVRRISTIVATKILQATGEPKIITDEDLNNQISILNNYSKGTAYNVDEQLINHFNKYNENVNVITKTDTITNNIIKTKGKVRVINNAVTEAVKTKIDPYVICPTSSVCDAMGNFGSCLNPDKNKKEYYNTDFIITYNEGINNYYGSSFIRKKDFTEELTIIYGFNLNNLSIYHAPKVLKIDEYRIVLSANATFKTVINKIIEIWKSSKIKPNKPEDLWSMLNNDALFESIITLGSLKAIGDIFQEIQSTLNNAGYLNPPNNIGFNNKPTYGLMGDRPSGMRIFKLLKDASNQAMLLTNVCGGYVGETNSLIYCSDAMKKIFNNRSNKSSATKKRKNSESNKSSSTSNQEKGSNQNKKRKTLKGGSNQKKRGGSNQKKVKMISTRKRIKKVITRKTRKKTVNP